MTVSYEVLSLLFVAIGSHRLFQTRRPRWAVVALTLLLVLPITRHLSTFMAGLTLTGAVVTAVARDRRRQLLNAYSDLRVLEPR